MTIVNVEEIAQSDTISERKLWSAVLKQALHDLKKGGSYASEAYKWFFEWDEEGSGSLEFVCNALNINKDYVRRKIKDTL